jgi:hypothetical protein
LEAIVASSARRFATQPDLLAGGMRRGVGAIPTILAKSSIQLVSVEDSLPGFVLPDHPVLHGRLNEGHSAFAMPARLATQILPFYPSIVVWWLFTPSGDFRISTSRPRKAYL